MLSTMTMYRRVWSDGPGPFLLLLFFVGNLPIPCQAGRVSGRSKTRTNTNGGIRPLRLFGHTTKRLGCRLQRRSSGLTWNSYVLENLQLEGISSGIVDFEIWTSVDLRY